MKAIHAQSLPSQSATVSYDDPNTYRAGIAYDDMSVVDRRTLAYMLICSGHYGGSYPRYMTPALFAAVKSFQRQNGDPSTGVPTKKTLEDLVALGGPLIGSLGMTYVDHPSVGGSVWIPSRLGLKRTATANGYHWGGMPGRPEIDFSHYPADWSLGRLRQAILDSDPQATILEDVFEPNNFMLHTKSVAGLSAMFVFHRVSEGNVGFRMSWKEESMPAGIRIGKLMAAGFSDVPMADGSGPR